MATFIITWPIYVNRYIEDDKKPPEGGILLITSDGTLYNHTHHCP